MTAPPRTHGQSPFSAAIQCIRSCRPRETEERETDLLQVEPAIAIAVESLEGSMQVCDFVRSKCMAFHGHILLLHHRASRNSAAGEDSLRGKKAKVGLLLILVLLLLLLLLLLLFVLCGWFAIFSRWRKFPIVSVPLLPRRVCKLYLLAPLHCPVFEISTRQL